ncbi:hypothetical protein D9M69_385240 [compost metagenome]
MSNKTSIPPSLQVLAADIKTSPEQYRAHFFLSGDVYIKDIAKRFRVFVANRLGFVPEFSYVWFVTNAGVAIAFAGNKFSLQLLPEYFEWCVEQGYVGKAMCGYLGWSKTKSEKLLNEALKVYSPLLNTRSYGGTLRTQGVEND